ncbi:hypothetical protein [Lacipirellula limnantheis]|nr:hypothetical protein [Lacipirellula limnantheis]
MKTQRPTTRAERRAKNPATLPAKWEPKFVDTADQRLKTIKLIRRRLGRLVEEAGCDSFQKELLAENAIFVAVQLETMRVNALEGKSFDAGVYTQMVNCLSGLLAKLGLNKQAAQVESLSTILAESRRAK